MKNQKIIDLGLSLLCLRFLQFGPGIVLKVFSFKTLLIMAINLKRFFTARMLFPTI